MRCLAGKELSRLGSEKLLVGPLSGVVLPVDVLGLEGGLLPDDAGRGGVAPPGGMTEELLQRGRGLYGPAEVVQPGQVLGELRRLAGLRPWRGFGRDVGVVNGLGQVAADFAEGFL